MILVAAFVLLVLAVVLGVIEARDRGPTDRGAFDPSTESYRRKLIEWERDE